MNGSPERDQSIERLLRQSLNVPREAVVTAVCLDAETVAAWADGGLSGAALDAVQLHVAECARCQSLVGALARTDIVAARVEPARAATWWRLGWLVPLTAAAAAIAIWVAVPTDTSDRRPAAPPLDADSAGKLRNREPMTDSAATPGPEASAATRSQQSFSVELEPAPAAALPQELRKDVARLEADSTTATAATGPARRERADGLSAGDRRNAAASASAGTGAVAVAPLPAAPDSGGRERTVAGQLAVPLTVPAPVPAPAARPAAESVATSNAAAPAAAALARVAGIEIISPDPRVRWRLTGARVERTADDGARWEPLRTGNTTELTAGSAPSALVCWLVGRDGVVLLSTDGQSWRRLPFPEATNLAGVRATDARAATVTTTDGRIFLTTNAGATWSR